MSIAARDSLATAAGSHALRKIAGNEVAVGGGEQDDYVIISADTFALTGKMPLSSMSHASTCSSSGSSVEGSTLSDVSPIVSSCSERTPMHVDEQAGNVTSTAAAASARSSPVKTTRTRLPTLEAIAARLGKKADASHGDDPSLDQENQSQQCTPVRPTARHAYTPTRPTEASPSKQARGRSEMLISLVDRAHDRSRSASPVKKESGSVATVAGMSGSGPSLQDIIKRMGTRKDTQSSSTTSSPALVSNATPPTSTPTLPATSLRDASTSTDSVSKQVTASVRKSPSKLDRIKPDEHPLEHRWSIYFDSKSWSAAGGHAEQPSKAKSWEATLKMLGRYDTVESFMTVFRTLRRPSQLERNSNYHVFKNGIKPMWEDAANLNGGKWIITLRTNNQALLDRSWMWLVLALIGEDLDENDDVTGAVVSTRAKGDRIALWVRDKSDVELVNRIGRRFVALLDVEHEAGVSLDFSPNSPEEVGDVSSSSSSSAVAGLRSSLRQEAATKYISFSNPAHSGAVGGASMQLPSKGPHTPLQAPSHAAFAHHAVSPLSNNAPSSPMQAQGTLGAHLRVHGSSPAKTLSRTSAAAPSLSRRGSQQLDNDGHGFAKGFGGPIGRNGSPAPAANPFRSSIGASPSGGGFGLMNRTKV